MTPNLDLSVERKRIEDAARAALVAYAPEFTAAAEQKARDTFPGQTGATFASVYAIVSGAPESFAVEQAAIQEALLLNPLHVETEEVEAPPPGVIRMWASVPTDYIDKLEADPTHAFLAPTLDEQQGAAQERVNQAIGGAS